MREIRENVDTCQRKVYKCGEGFYILETFILIVKVKLPTFRFRLLRVNEEPLYLHCILLTKYNFRAQSCNTRVKWHIYNGSSFHFYLTSADFSYGFVLLTTPNLVLVSVSFCFNIVDKITNVFQDCFVPVIKALA